MRRRLSAIALLASLAFAATAQICAAAPLPAAQGENQNALVAKAQAALDAKQWPDAEAALKQLSASEPRWEYFEALGAAQFNQGHYADSLNSYQRAIDLAGKSASPGAIGQLYTTIGNANLKLKKNDAAIAAYNTEAAKQDPPKEPLPIEASAYSFRHARISELLQIHSVDPLTVAAQTGTSLVMIEKAYLRFIPHAMREKLAGIKGASPNSTTTSTDERARKLGQ